jgi:hypothetical protein
MAASTAPRRAIAAGALVLATGAATVGMTTQAHAAATPPPPAPDNTTAHVTVNSVLAIDVNPPDFYLDGAPGDSDTAQVTVNVKSNNATGYTVTLNAPGSLNMVAPGSGTMAIGELKLDPGTGTATALISGDQAAPVGTGTGPTPIAGTNATHIYSITIPSVAPGEYTAVLTYTATANPTP